MAEQAPNTPGWLWAVGIVAVGSIGGGMVYALWIGVINLGRIGV